jgi:PAS domain S-box-containing protein
LRVVEAMQYAPIMGQRDHDLDYLNLAQVAIVVLDREGRVIRINRKGCWILGREDRDVVGRNWFESFIPERLRDRLAGVHGQLMADDVEPVEYFENPVVNREGEERLVAWHNTVLRDPEGSIVGSLSSGEDITERKRAEQELSDIRYALDQAAIVAITDGRGIIRYANDKFCEISQFSREELIGQDHRMLNSGYHPKEFIRNLWRTISSGKVWRGEIRNRAKDGGIYWVDTTIVPFTDDRGKPYQFLAIRSDITDRKRAEDELRQQESLARVGQMAAVVAHEVKNPLAGIGGAIEIIGGRLPSDSPDRQVVANILQRIDSLNRRVQDLLLFSRPRTPRIATVRLPALLHETAELLSEDPTLASVKVEIFGPELSLAGDPEQLKDVFLNLLLNAGQAMGGNGNIRVSAEPDNDACRITVEDSGAGMPPEVKEKIFEPFFTTKNQGTGLGLAIAKHIVDGHGGAIGVESTAGRGTRITVSLPLGPRRGPVGKA